MLSRAFEPTIMRQTITQYASKRVPAIVATVRCWHSMTRYHHATSSKITVPCINSHIPRRMVNIFTTETTSEIFHHQIDHLMDLLQERLEHDDVESQNLDLSYSSGVLSVLSEEGTWILNGHSVTRQCWVSSPISGPSKWNWHEDLQSWRNERDQSLQLKPFLEKEFSSAFNTSITFDHSF